MSGAVNQNRVYRVGFSGYAERHQGGYRSSRQLTVLAENLEHALHKARLRVERDGYTNVQIWSANHIATIDEL